MRNLIAKLITKLVNYMNNMHIPDHVKHSNEYDEVQQIVNKAWCRNLFVPFVYKRERSAAECSRGGHYVR